MKTLPLVLPFALALSLVSARGDSTIDPADKYAWGANIGWINFNPLITP